MIEYEVIPDTNIIEFVIEGKATKDELVPLLDATNAVIAEHGKVRMLKQIRGPALVTIELSAFWENLRWGFKNLKNIERVAGVADQEWIGKITKIVDPLFSAEMCFFPTAEIDAARAWLREPATPETD
ncbi:MAG: STAS/SEC14 domain-containing protein [Planctomycetota bacterium]